MKVLSAQNQISLNQSKFHNVKPNVVVSDFSSKNNNTVISGVLSANYFSPSFSGLTSPASLEIATKKMYNAMGCNYLLPNQVWSKTKILDTISSFAEKFEKVIDKSLASPETAQKTLNSMLSEDESKKIIVKSMNDLVKDLKAEGIDKRTIDCLSDSEAFTMNFADKSVIYADFANANKSERNKVALQNGLCHELKHAFTSNFTNVHNIDSFNLKKANAVCDDVVVSNMFSEIENAFSLEVSEQNAAPVFKNVLINLDMDSKEEFIDELKLVTKEVLSDYKASGQLNISTPAAKKAVFSAFKNIAEDEKEAYQFNNMYRKFAKNPEKPTVWELVPVLYEELANFFGALAK
ncbi:MAG: hypothetical protein MJ229_03960 [bacterium]|nr:hypothetical protein [bacterium]